jgi:hypothetical protein
VSEPGKHGEHEAMCMTKRLLAIWLSAFGFAAGHAAATPLASIDVPMLVETSDLVVVGRPDTIATAAGGGQTFSLSVARVLKGGAASARRIRVVLDREPPNRMGERQLGIFFLRKRQPGDDYAAADLMHVALAASPERDTAGRPSGDPLAAVAHELTRVLITPEASLTRRGTAEAAQSVYFQTAAALKSIPYEIAGAGLRAAAGSDMPAARLWALNCLIAISSPDDRETFVLEQLDSARAILLKPPREIEYAVHWLASTMEGRFRSRGAVRVLAPLLHSTSVAVRRASAATLSRIATPEVVAPLARVALNDPERQVRFFAALGLAWANKTAGPTLSDFDDDEDRILRQWRDWARANVR